MRNPSKASSSEANKKKKNKINGMMSSSSNVVKMNSNSNSNKTTPCCSKVGLKRGPWTPEEDEILSKYIQKEGEGRWRTLPKRAGLLRCGKSCRLRWMNYLRPSVKRGHIAPDEEDLILRLHRLLGNRWSLIAGRIPGRTDNEIKNYWNTHLSKKLISQGIDPRTHKPLNNPVHHSGPVLFNNLNKAAASTQLKDDDDDDGQQPNPNKNNIITEAYKATEVAAADNQMSSGMLIDGIYTHLNGDGDGDNDHDHEYDELGHDQYHLSQSHHHQYNVAAHASNHIIAEEDEEDMNLCTDQLFSSFLNSLINEEAFAAHHQQHNQLLLQASQHNSNYNYMMSNNNTIVPQQHHDHDHLPPVSDALDTTNWESAFMSSPSFNQNDPNKLS